MSTAQIESVQVAQAVFSVCIAPELVGPLMLSVEGISGAIFAGEFQEYIPTDRRPQFPPVVRDANTCVAIVDCDANPEKALETMERLQQLLPNRLRIIAMASNAEASFLLRAMRVGCNEFLNKPMNPLELAAALKRFQENMVMVQPVAETGKLFAFFGVKGGVGTTTLAVHLATHLVRKHGKRVLLVDHKHQLGHVSLYLGLKGAKYYFGELLRNADRLDADLLEGFVVRHPSGLEVIASPEACAPQHQGSQEAMERVLQYLRQRYEYVLFDSDTEYTNSIAPLIAASEEIPLIATPDVAALRDMARYVEHLGMVDTFASKLRVVINRCSSDTAINAEQIAQAIRFPVSVEIPNNYMEIVRSINAGEPIGPQTRGAFTTAIGKWANRLSAMTELKRPETAVKKRFSLFGGRS